MGGELETFRRGKLGQAGSLSWHPINQEFAKRVQDRQERGKESPKVINAARRKIRQGEFMQDLPRFQFNRALGNMFNGIPLQEVADLTPENIAYVARHIDKHERLVETCETEKGRKVLITIVDFTRRDRL